MDKDIRRERLRTALAGRQIRPEDKSYISQLLSSKVAFGEKAARRLERDYLLPAMSLDQPFDECLPDPLTKEALVARISSRLAELHIEKLKALAVVLDA